MSTSINPLNDTRFVGLNSNKSQQASKNNN